MDRFNFLLKQLFWIFILKIIHHFYLVKKPQILKKKEEGNNF
jgi:hypothetical protein